MTQNTAAGEWKTGSQIQLKQNGKRWSRKAVKTIWQIRYALQCGTELLIWELGLLNLSFHYSNRNPKDICSLQFSGQWARSVVLTVKVGLSSILRRGSVAVLCSLCSVGNFAVPPHGHWVNSLFLNYSNHEVLKASLLFIIVTLTSSHVAPETLNLMYWAAF